jgi:hypothetical protein
MPVAPCNARQRYVLASNWITVPGGRLLTYIYSLNSLTPEIRRLSCFDVLLYTIVFSTVMPTTTVESETQWNYMLTTDPVSGSIFSGYSTTLG